MSSLSSQLMLVIASYWAIMNAVANTAIFTALTGECDQATVRSTAQLPPTHPLRGNGRSQAAAENAVHSWRTFQL